ncbi:hypothetical protein [Massilia sp.]|uniref:hypothetical protein n=1 Tax=Massilia sp. TaxID=1882437 RepID=UPI00289D8304|nr:hypothetical protein [Massilia sp.]
MMTITTSSSSSVKPALRRTGSTATPRLAAKPLAQPLAQTINRLLNCFSEKHCRRRLPRGSAGRQLFFAKNHDADGMAIAIYYTSHLLILGNGANFIRMKFASNGHVFIGKTKLNQEKLRKLKITVVKLFYTFLISIDIFLFNLSTSGAKALCPAVPRREKFQT